VSRLLPQTVLLIPSEKKVWVIPSYAVLTSEQSGIDARATAYGITTEKTDYDTALSALTTYLGTLTTPVAWNNTSGNTNVTRTTWDSKWNDVRVKKQILLNKIDQLAGTVSTWTGVTGTGKAADFATVNNVTYSISAPSSPVNGDIWVDTSVTPNVAKVRVAGAWQIASNYVTNTTHITDGANLGQTAIWGSVTGSGKPADNATVNNLTYSTSAPGSPVNGDIWVDTSVTPNVVRVRVTGAWQVASNYTTNTNQLTDGASLGSTAIWGSVSGKPANIGALVGSEVINNQLILDRIDNDNLVTIGEKFAFSKLSADVEARYQDLKNRAVALGLSTTNVDNARLQWRNLTSSFSPSLYDFSQDTNIFTTNKLADELFPTNWNNNGVGNISTTAAVPYIRCSDTDSGNFYEIYRGITGSVVIGQEYACGWVVKKDTTTTRRPLFRVVCDGVTFYAGIILDTSTGAWTTENSNALIQGVYSLDDLHWFVVLSIIAPSGTTLVRNSFFPAGANSSGSVVATATGSIDILGAPMLVQGVGTFGLGRVHLNATLAQYGQQLTALAKAISEVDGITSVVIDPIPDVVIYADSTGTIKSGQLPAGVGRDVGITASAGNANVTTLCSWGRTVTAGITCSIGPSTGIFNITALTATDVSVPISLSYAGVTRTGKVHVVRRDDAPSTTGGVGGGGGGTGGSSGSNNALGNTTGTTYDATNAVSGEITFNTGTTPKIDLVANISFQRTATTNGFTGAAGKWQIKLASSGTYADVGTETADSGDAQTEHNTGDPLNQYPGTLYVTQTITTTSMPSLAASTAYKVRFLWRDVSVSGSTSRITNVGASLTATGS
jgi:hypothetical protein